MGSDLYNVEAISKRARQVTLRVQCIHPDVVYSANSDAGFALMLLYEAVPYNGEAPLTSEVSFDDTLSEAWMREYARGFVRASPGL